MSCADAIASLLADAHFTSYFTKVLPSALDCAESIVVTEGRSRASLGRLRRSAVPCVTVAVVREAAVDAEAVVVAAERAVRGADWEPYADAGAYRIVGIDTAAPVFKERDRSGRFVWAFDVTCTVVRSLWKRRRLTGLATLEILRLRRCAPSLRMTSIRRAFVARGVLPSTS